MTWVSERLLASLLRIGNNPSTGVLLRPSPNSLDRSLLLIIVIQRLGRHIPGLAPGFVPLLRSGTPSQRRLSIRTSAIFLPLFIPFLMSRLTRLLRGDTLFRVATHPRLVLSLLAFQLPGTQQLVNLAVSEDLDLLICQGALHPVWVVA